MEKTAIIYDKWLHSLGGGEVVACTMARILKENGYDVFLISGKKVPKETIKKKMNIDLSKGIKFIEIWNDELKLKKIIKGKDLFINTSFLDYSLGCAKKNIYYVHFPSKAYEGLRNIIKNQLIFPFLSKIMRPVEFLNKTDNTTIVDNHLAYLIKDPIRVAFSYLSNKKTYQIKFSVFFERFFKNLFETIHWGVNQAHVLDSRIKVDHHHNVVHFSISIKPITSTAYLHMELKTNPTVSFIPTRAYLLYPKILPSIPLFSKLFKRVYEKIANRLRRGLFVNVIKRLESYQVILANSNFTKYWIKQYWNRDSLVLYPPSQMLFKKNNFKNIRKKKWICSLGRFFTLGHDKKQEILIKAFKKLYDLGYKDWQFHLIGGLGNEPSSLRFAKYLKTSAKGYPIFFHFNADRKIVETILSKSKFYWHATGFKENPKKNPIKFEHFGIAPIEALSAKCIPILYNGGGLKEIISALNLDEGKHLFSTIKELVDNTVYFMKEKKQFNWNGIFRDLENNFSTKAFEKKFKSLI